MVQSALPRPQPPIFVLGKRDDYLFVAPTVEEAVANTNRYVPHRAAQAGVLVLEDLEFFDVAGQPLEQIVLAGEFVDLAVRDRREEIRGRIRKIFRSFELLAQDAEQGDPHYTEWVAFPDKPVTFEAFADGLVTLLTEDDASQDDVRAAAGPKRRRGWLYWATHR